MLLKLPVELEALPQALFLARGDFMLLEFLFAIFVRFARFARLGICALLGCLKLCRFGLVVEDMRLFAALFLAGMSGVNRLEAVVLRLFRGLRLGVVFGFGLRLFLLRSCLGFLCGGFLLRLLLGFILFFFLAGRARAAASKAAVNSC